MRVLLALAILASTSGAPSEERALSVPWIFGDHMVLQHGRELPIRGTAAAGAEVSVTLGGIERVAEADAFGSWSVTLEAREASAEGAVLRIASGAESVEFRDVIFGDVYLCAGQSNMAFELRRASAAEALVESAEVAELRLCNRRASPWPRAGAWTEEELAKVTPETLFGGEWERSSRSAAAEFSAVAYAFGRELLPHAGVPIGLVHVAVGGSTTEGWIKRKRLRMDRLLAPLAEDFLATGLSQPWVRDRARENLGAYANRSPRPLHVFEPGLLFDAVIASCAPFPFRGVLWYQGESNEVVRRSGATPIDVRAALAGSPDLFPDHLHPNAGGAKRISEAVGDAIVK